MKTYDEMLSFPTFEERYRYLKLPGEVGIETFGFDRYINQQFYGSREWRQTRQFIIARDNACDLAIFDREIHENILIHHLNPLRLEDITERTSLTLDPQNLVCVSRRTHNAIHYGEAHLLVNDYEPRTPGDTIPWKKVGETTYDFSIS